MASRRVERRDGVASARARRELRGYAAEQAALRRVATLVARTGASEDVFDAVVAEVGQLLAVEASLLNRYEPDGTATTVVGSWARTGAAVAFPVGTRWVLGGRNVSTFVMATGRAARIDDYDDAAGMAADLARERGIRSSVGVPIIVDGCLWGHMSVATTHKPRFPSDTEERLARFTELIATAIANAQARIDLRDYASEQAALRRVATLVAKAALPRDVFAAVTEEIGQLLGADFTVMQRYDADGAATVLGAWAQTDPVPNQVGDRHELGGRNITTLVRVTGAPARIDRYGADAGPAPVSALAAGMHSAVGAPINVGGRLWGVVIAGCRREDPLPMDTEARLAGFTELVASAIANTESQAELTASRARVVAAADNTRRRIERDLHDGAQQRLVTFAMRLRAAQATVPRELVELHVQFDQLVADATVALDELRELARGIHPAALADGGLRRALKAIARRSAVPVRLDMSDGRRFPAQVEIAAYYVVSEALTNAAKHAGASAVDVEVEATGAVLRVRVRDDGCGGADLAGGSGLVGLKDRVEALAGRLSLQTAPGAGTCVEVELPLDRSEP